MSFLTSLLGYTNPADSAQPTLNQIPSTITPYYQPYVNSGNNLLPYQTNLGEQEVQSYYPLQSQYSSLTSGLPQLQQQYGNLTGAGTQLQNQYSSIAANPNQNLNQIGAGYQQSPGYNFALQQALMASNNTAAAGGLSGSPQNQQNNASVASGLANQDYYNYLGNALSSQQSGLSGLSSLYGTGLTGTQGLYGAGLSGQQGILAQGNQTLNNLEGQGYSAATGLAGNLGNALLTQANLAYSGAANQNSSITGALGGLGSLAGIASDFF